jgi:uncharacterized protein YndB with AHSA1/START domain
VTDELRTEGGAPYVHVAREYDATPQEVWDCWTDPGRLSRWLGDLDDALGERPVRLTLGTGTDDWADVTVLTADEPALLELRWQYPGEDDTVLRVEIVQLRQGRTRLVLEHRGLGDAATGYGAGWHAYVARLGAVLSASEPPAWDEVFAAALPVWRARQATSSATG